MFRNRVRPPSPPLDEITAERLLRGAPIEDLPDAFRPLGQLLADANAPASADELRGSAAAAAAFIAAHHAANAPRRRMRTMTASVLTALTLAATTGTAVAATQGSLPEPVQQVAHEALGAVGISVPGIAHKDDGTDGGVEPASVNRGANGTTATTAPATTPTQTGARVIPATPGDGTTSSDPATGSENAGGTGNGNGTPQGGDGVAGENPNAGAGNNSGNGNPNPGEGNNGGGNGGGAVETPSNNLPPQSNGKGNGPPQVPPGQAKE
jgi:hypothetical protein